MTNKDINEIPAWCWFWLPITVICVQLSVRLMDQNQGFYSKLMEGEAGFIENATAIVLFPAVILGLRLHCRFYRLRQRRLSLWFLMIALLCLGFLGEEISWGQHWAGWQSPDIFEQHNRQQETNVHNLNLVVNLQLERLARTVFTLAIAIGGIIIPLRVKRRGTAVDPSEPYRGLCWPTMVCLPTASLMLGVRVIERLRVWLDLHELPFMGINFKETLEFYLALFFLIYLYSAHARLKAVKLPPDPLAR